MIEVLPPNEHDPEEIRRAADEILEGADYDRAEPDFIERAIEWIVERLGDFFGDLGSPFGSAGGGGSAGISWILLVVGSLLLIWMVVRYRRTRVAKDFEPESSVVLDPSRTGDEWRAEAGRHELAGEWSEAIRAEYRALVSDLVEADLVPDIPGRTAGEYRLDVARDLPAITEPFDRATELFEPVWYSDLVPDRGGLESIRALAADVDVDALASAETPRESAPADDVRPS